LRLFEKMASTSRTSTIEGVKSNISCRHYGAKMCGAFLRYFNCIHQFLHRFLQLFLPVLPGARSNGPTIDLSRFTAAAAVGDPRRPWILVLGACERSSTQPLPARTLINLLAALCLSAVHPTSRILIQPNFKHSPMLNGGESKKEAWLFDLRGSFDACV
jgi:hypothetical protein